MTYVLPTWCKTWPDEQRKKAERTIEEANRNEQVKEERFAALLNLLIQPEPSEEDCY